MRPSRSGLVGRGAAVILAVCLATAGLAGCVQYATVPPITPLPSPTPTMPAPEMPDQLVGASGFENAWLLVSIEENGYAHLFRFELESAALTRLTWGNWNDITPSLSPDGASTAFASDRGGFWDLYVMDLLTGSVTQLTNTPEYDGAPIWSPDMAWMAYETYNDGQLDIAIQSLTDATTLPVLLTEDPGADHSPAWAPDGRRIAFVSSRTGDADVWLADLDKTSERFINLSASPRAAESHPTWSRDGSRLAWAARVNGPGYSGIYVWDAGRRGIPAAWAGSGIWPAWSADGTRMAVVLDAPTQQLISAYTLNGPPMILPAPLPGVVRGFAWPERDLPAQLPAPFEQASLATPEVPSSGSVSGLPDVPSKRWHIVPLEDVQAPSAGLHALVAPSFAELRARIVAEAGWDVLASLENTFVPFTTSLDPGFEQDWLYTGRAFAINTLMLNAGWMAAEREDIDGQTFWRIYVRTRDQDGSAGIPIKDPPWDLNTRYQLNPQAYEDGGSYAPVPSGYWLDLTALAEHYGWHRLPALPSWRTYYVGARFSEFAATGGLDWYSAMLELYPVEALITPTAVLPPTITPSRTPRPTTTPYPTWTPRPTRTATTSPIPSASPTPLPPTNTPPPTSTPPTVIPTFPSATP